MRHTFQLVMLTLTFSVALANAATAASRPAVVELFTSEGCSSCPPAELIANQLAQRRDVLVLSYHVDYWDNLGWRDRYSLASATARQRGYARALHRSSVYTPQAVIDGLQDIVGSQRSALIEAVSAPREGIATSLAVSGDTAQIHVDAGADPGSANVLLVGYLREAITPIGRGENSGRTLKESNIVVSLESLGQWNGKPKDFKFALSRLPKSVTDIAVLVQSVDQGAILSAAALPVH